MEVNNQDGRHIEQIDVNALIHRQIQLVQGINTISQDRKVSLTGKIRGIFDNQCELCGMRGHRVGYCWFNAMMYQEVKGDPQLKVAWWQVKQHGKNLQRLADLQRHN